VQPIVVLVTPNPNGTANAPARLRNFTAARDRCEALSNLSYPLMSLATALRSSHAV
jgi:hypothetical protein